MKPIGPDDLSITLEILVMYMYYYMHMYEKYVNEL